MRCEDRCLQGKAAHLEVDDGAKGVTHDLGTTGCGGERGGPSFFVDGLANMRRKPIRSHCSTSTRKSTRGHLGFDVRGGLDELGTAIERALA